VQPRKTNIYQHLTHMDSSSSWEVDAAHC